MQQLDEEEVGGDHVQNYLSEIRQFQNFLLYKESKKLALDFERLVFLSLITPPPFFI